MTVSLLEGHVVSVLEGLPAGHFHTVCTSPPYLWLRSYGTEPLAWDGDAGCAHEWGAEERGKRGDLLPREQSSSESRMGLDDRQGFGPPSGGRFCTKCGAWRGELGQEPTPELYVEHLVAVFRAVRRVLRADGCLWVNLAGCYFNDPGGQNGGVGNTLDYGAGRVSPKVMEANRQNGRQKRGRHPWLKPLDWVDVPGLFARAMQQDGWTWRSDVVWVKPSALPESVSGTRWEKCRVNVQAGTASQEPSKQASGTHGATLDRLSHGSRAVPERVAAAEAAGSQWADCPGCAKCAPDGLVLRRGSGRPTKATERVLLFVKGPGYYFDQEAVREAHTPGYEYTGRSGLSADGYAPKPKAETGGARESVLSQHREYHPAGRNLRDWWVIGPEPLKDAHYAAYPSALPERCIKAGTSEWGCCPSCGAPWARVVAQRHFQRYELPVDHEHHRPARYDGGKAGVQYGERGQGITESTTLGWRPTCGPTCPGATEPPSPARVLDPFSGSGTTLLAANRLGRDATGVDLKPQYNALARKRLGREPLSLFAWRTDDTPEEVPL